jgi:hypothetical protein
MARESERKELWHQLDNESDRAHEAFRTFMYLPPAERSVVRAWREWSANPDAKREPPYFAGWARDFAWSDRARAHDHHIEIIRESGMEEAIREEAARQARQVEQVRGRFNELMAITYERAIEYLEDEDFIKQLRPADVVQILKIHLETTQKLGGPTDAPGDSTAVDWSEDEQRELDRILDEIESEIAQEEETPEPESGENDGSEEGPTEQT